MKKATKLILAEAVGRMLKPLIKVLIRNDVSHGEFVALAKRAYVDVAYEHFSIPGRKTTYSRVAVLTGLNRKEVVALTKEKEEGSNTPKGRPNRAIRVVNGWLNDSEFLDENNEAKVLPIQGEHGSFSALVARYSGDITLGAVVDELERTGIVSRPDKQSVKLNSYGYIPADNELEKIKIMSTCAADLLASAVHNQEQSSDDARFQRQVVYRKVPKQVVSQFKEYSDNKSLVLLRDYNRWLEESTNQLTPEQDEPTSRVGVGIYYFEEKN
ncbi:MAG: DUF6502 family protein [Gammaproteobacteria bacterium]|nr:DUF6502 family protein [Gammaproteobacteria bacterium]